jgi:hypothetical protein
MSVKSTTRKKVKRALPYVAVIVFVASYLTGCCCCPCGAPTPTPDPGTGGEFAVQPVAAATAGPLGHATGMAF